MLVTFKFSPDSPTYTDGWFVFTRCEAPLWALSTSILSFHIFLNSAKFWLVFSLDPTGQVMQLWLWILPLPHSTHYTEAFWRMLRRTQTPGEQKAHSCSKLAANCGAKESLKVGNNVCISAATIRICLSLSVMHLGKAINPIITNIKTYRIMSGGKMHIL